MVARSRLYSSVRVLLFSVTLAIGATMPLIVAGMTRVAAVFVMVAVFSLVMWVWVRDGGMIGGRRVHHTRRRMGSRRGSLRSCVMGRSGRCRAESAGSLGCGGVGWRGSGPMAEGLPQCEARQAAKQQSGNDGLEITLANRARSHRNRHAFLDKIDLCFCHRMGAGCAISMPIAVDPPGWDDVRDACDIRRGEARVLLLQGSSAMRRGSRAGEMEPQDATP